MLHEILETARIYTEKFGWAIFPCNPADKAPRTEHGFQDASRDRDQIVRWWRQWPDALIGIACGMSGIAVLDVDVKNPKKYGPDSLELLGRSVLDDTPIAHTRSGGWHCYYATGSLDIPSSTNTIGPGLDVRARGGYIIAPSPGSGYRWDDHCTLDTLPLAAAPAWLIPPLPEPIRRAKPVRPTVGLSPYADAAIERACCAIRDAPDGEQRKTLVRESFAIGTLAGAGGIPESFARLALIDAGCGMPNFEPQPWTQKEVERVVNQCFAAGVAHPRPTTNRRAS